MDSEFIYNMVSVHPSLQRGDSLVGSPGIVDCIAWHNPGDARTSLMCDLSTTTSFHFLINTSTCICPVRGSSSSLIIVLGKNTAMRPRRHSNTPTTKHHCWLVFHWYELGFKNHEMGQLRKKEASIIHPFRHHANILLDWIRHINYILLPLRFCFVKNNQIVRSLIS